MGNQVWLDMGKGRRREHAMRGGKKNGDLQQQTATLASVRHIMNDTLGREPRLSVPCWSRQLLR